MNIVYLMLKQWGKVERIYEDLTIHSNVYK